MGFDYQKEFWQIFSDLAGRRCTRVPPPSLQGLQRQATMLRLCATGLPCLRRLEMQFGPRSPGLSGHRAYAAGRARPGRRASPRASRDACVDGRRSHPRGGSQPCGEAPQARRRRPPFPRPPRAPAPPAAPRARSHRHSASTRRRRGHRQGERIAARKARRPDGKRPRRRPPRAHCNCRRWQILQSWRQRSLQPRPSARQTAGKS